MQHTWLKQSSDCLLLLVKAVKWLTVCFTNSIFYNFLLLLAWLAISPFLDALLILSLNLLLLTITLVSLTTSCTTSVYYFTILVNLDILAKVDNIENIWAKARLPSVIKVKSLFVIKGTLPLTVTYLTSLLKMCLLKQ